MVSLGGLAVAGAVAGGATSGASRRPVGGSMLVSFSRRRRLRVAFTDDHATRLQPLFDRFQQEYDASIDVTALPAPDLFSRLAVDLLHQTASVDVVSLSDDWIPSLGRTAVLLSDADLAGSPVLDRLHPRVGDLGRSVEDDRLVAIPWTMDIGFAGVATALLGGGAAPRRWSDLLGVLQSAGQPSCILAGSSGEAAAATFRSILAGYGTDIVEAGTNRPTVTDYDARRAMAVMLGFQAATSVSPLAVDESAVARLLGLPSGGSCPHAWASTWLQTGVASTWTLLPALRASAPRGTRLLRAWLLAIPRSSVDIDLSRTFIAWMTTSLAQRSILDDGLIPVATDVLRDRAELASRPTLREIVRGIPEAIARPRLRAFPEINRVCGEAVATILAGNATAGVAFRSANAEMRRVLEREGELRL